MADLNFDIKNLTAESAENLLRSGNSFSQTQILDLIIIFLTKISSNEKMYALDRIRGFMPKNLDIPIMAGENKDTLLIKKNNVLVRAQTLQKLLRENYGENKELPSYIIEMKNKTLDEIKNLEKRIKRNTDFKSGGGVIDITRLESEIEADSRKLEKTKEWMEIFYTEFLVFEEFYKAVKNLEDGITPKNAKNESQKYSVRKFERNVFVREGKIFGQR